MAKKYSKDSKTPPHIQRRYSQSMADLFREGKPPGGFHYPKGKPPGPKKP